MSLYQFLAPRFLTVADSDFQPSTIRLFTEYSVNTELFRGSICVTSSGLPVSIEPQFPVPKPATADISLFQVSALSSLYSHLGFATCSYGLEAKTSAPPNLLSTSLTVPLPTSTGKYVKAASMSSSSTSTQSNTSRSSSEDPSHQTKIAIGIGLSVVVPLLFALAFFLGDRYRKIRSVSLKRAIAQRERELQEDGQPYLQHKAELEAEENRKHELDALETPHQIGNEGERYELPANEGDVIKMRQELRGEEHSKELEVQQ